MRWFNFILATAMLAGTIIGAGVFGLPYVASQAGLAPAFFYLVILTVVVVAIHLIYGEIVLRTKTKHRLPGYARIYLGQTGRWLATVIFFVSLYLALLAYLLIGGEFLSVLVSGWHSITPALSTLILAIFGFGLIFFGLKLSGIFELLMTAVLITMMLGLVFYGFDFVNSGNLTLFESSAAIFLPYGVILFSLSGGSAIPEIRNFFGRGRTLKKAIICGTIIPAIVYGLFMLVVVGISGRNTSAEAIKGLASFLGNGFVKYGAAVGFLAVITSFLTLGLNIKNSLRLDFKLPHFLSFVLTAGVPLALYFSGWNNFIKILSFSGAVMGGLEGILLLVIWNKARLKGDREPEYVLGISRLMQLVLFAILVLGVFYQFMHGVL